MTAADEAEAAAALAALNEAASIKNADEIAQAKLQIGTKADPEVVPTDVPGWVTLSPIEDAVFPRSELVPIPTIGSGGALEWIQPVYTAALNRLDIGYINATRARIYNTVGFIIANQSVSTPATLRVHVYKMERPQTGGQMAS
ncbi:hypothetical protein GS461_09570 [Rhodococcus hoagii]|nr:hypothetical protein [Prescottella equi]